MDIVKVHLGILILIGFITSIFSHVDELNAGTTTKTLKSSITEESPRSSQVLLSSSSSEFNILQKILGNCQSTDDFLGCLKGKALSAITKAIDQDSIKITDGIILQKQNQTEKESFINELTDARTLNNLPAVDKSLLQKLDNFLRNHVIKVDLSSEGRDYDESEDKGKGGGYGGGGGGDKGGYGGGGGGGGSKGGYKNKGGGGGMSQYILATLLTAVGIVAPLTLKVLAFAAGKALVTSKIALTIAAIIALKKLFSHDHHEETSFQVHSGEHNRRNTYIVKALKPSASVDPYRYYYDYPAYHH